MPESQQSNDPQHISVRAVGWGAAAILGGIVFAVVAAWATWHYLGSGSGANRGPGAAKAEAPRLLTAPQPDRAAYFAEKQRVIDSYGWVDRQAGIARIPVGEAMRLMADRAQAGRAQR
jgi:hypothetical protein